MWTARQEKSGESGDFAHRAKELLRQRLFTPAIAILRHGLDDDPTYAKAELLLCRALVAAKRFEEAREALTDFVQREDSLPAYTLLIRVCLVLQDGAGACNAAQQAKQKYFSKELLALSQDAKALRERNSIDDAVTSHDELGYYRALLARDSEEWSHSEIGALPQGDDLEDFDDDPLEEPTPKVALEQVASDEYAAALRADQATDQPTDLSAIQVNSLGVESPAEDDVTDQTTTRDPIDARVFGAEMRREVEEGQIIEERPEAPSDPDNAAADPDAADAADPDNAIDGEDPDEEAAAEPVDDGLDELTPRTYGRLLGADAPDLSTAVERFAAAVAPKETDDAEVSVSMPLLAAPLLDALLGDGPSLSEPRVETADALGSAVVAPGAAEKPPVADVHVVIEAEDGLTPPATPVAMRRTDAQETQRTTEPQADPAPEPEEVDSQAEKATTKYSASERTFDSRPQIEAEAVPTPLQSVETDSLPKETARRRAQNRRKPFAKVGSWLFLSLLIFASVAGGLTLRRSRQAADILAKARQLSEGHQARNLRQALYLLRRAADRVGRKGEILSLAAALHARLAVQFGESQLSRVDALLSESQALGDLGREDQMIARAYLILARSDADKSVGRLAEIVEATRGPLLSLETWAELRRGNFEAASGRLDALSEDGWTWPLRFQLALRRGDGVQAETLLTQAGVSGISLAQQALARAKYDVLFRRKAPSVEADLVALSSENLAAAERSWVDLLLATVHQRRGAHNSALGFLNRMTSGAPMLDGLFHKHRAELAFLLADYQAAQLYIRRARWITTNDPQLERLEIRIDLASGKKPAAIKRLRSMLKVAKSHWAIGLYAEVLYAHGDRNGLASLLQSNALSSSIRKEISARLSLLQNRSRKALVHLRGTSQYGLLAKAHLRSGNRSQARASIESVALASRTPEQLAIEGEVLFAAGEVNRAKGALRAALSRAPHYLPARRLLSTIYLTEESWVQAAENSRSLLGTNAEDSLARRHLARALVEMRSPGANEILSDPSVQGSNWSRLLRVRQEMLKGSWQNAEKHLTFLDESWIETESLALLWQAEIYQRVGDDQAAVLIFKDLLTDSAFAVEAHLGLSRVYSQQGKKAAARWWAMRGQRTSAKIFHSERVKESLAAHTTR
jgi:hypothetical protein